MGRLVWKVNVSPSAMKMAKSCQRRWYLAKVASWGGWNGQLGEPSRDAYILSKMQSLAGLAGNAVHQVIRRAIVRNDLAGKDEGERLKVSMVAVRAAEQQFDAVVADCRAMRWQQNPKKCPPIRELVLENLAEDVDVAIAEQRQRIGGLVRSAFRSDELVRIGEDYPHPMTELLWEQPGRLEGTMFSAWAVPDVLGIEGSAAEGWDWKTGKPRDEHEMDARWYARVARDYLGEHSATATVSIHYVYLSETGGEPEVVTYKVAPEDRVDAEEVKGFVRMAAGAPSRSASEFPKSEGPACNWCDMLPACTGSWNYDDRPGQDLVPLGGAE